MKLAQSPMKDQLPEAFGMLVDRFGTPRMVNGGAAKSME